MDTIPISKKIIVAITTTTLYLRNYKTLQNILKVILTVAGVLLAVSSFIGLIGVGIAVVIFLLGGTLNQFVESEQELKVLKIERFILLIIAIELLLVTLITTRTKIP